jgi:hypothetical protein
MTVKEEQTLHDVFDPIVSIILGTEDLSGLQDVIKTHASKIGNHL